MQLSRIVHKTRRYPASPLPILIYRENGVSPEEETSCSAEMRVVFLGSAPMRAGFVEKLSAQLLLDEPFTGNLAFGDLNAPVDVSCCARRVV